MWGRLFNRIFNSRSSTGKLKKMRYKVNFHVMLWFLSSCTINIMGNQAPNSLSHADSIRNRSTDNGTTHNGSNTFLINENHHQQHHHQQQQQHINTQQNGHLASEQQQQLNISHDTTTQRSTERKMGKS